MKIFLSIIALIAINIVSAFGQTDSIIVKKVFGGYQCYQNGLPLKMRQFAKIAEVNSDVARKVKSAKTMNAFASILGFAGGFMVGWPLGTALGGGDPNWAIAGVGAGLIVASILLSTNANKKIKRAADIYNSGLKTSSFWNKSELRFSVNESGVGLILQF